ncbi:acetyl-CoA acetyltransferase [Ahrensia marina]|nr:acetyl-CoA acetyltransferase [Ahrensia marina]
MYMAVVTGWAHTQFGKLTDKTVEDLIGDVAIEAIEKAGLSAEEIDAVCLGTFNAGLVRQDFAGSLVSIAVPELRHTPATRYENACATGSAAIHGALDKIAAGKARHVLVIGVEKMTALPTAEVGDVLLKASYVEEEADIDAGFAGIFGRITSAYYQKFGDQSDALAHIAAKNHANGTLNPLAHMQKDFGFAFCNQISEKNPYVAGPLRRTDCSLISDGAAALVISQDETAQTMDYAISFRAAEQVNDYLALSKKDPTEFLGAQLSWNKALESAQLTLDDLSFAEVHDCFTIAELIEYEVMGLAKRGRGGDVARSGETSINGRLPVNPSGGLKAKGHPVGATGVSMHVMATKQLMGETAGAKVKNAKLAAIFNMGGTAVANYTSILERFR